jgi:hypothetical protein
MKGKCVGIVRLVTQIIRLEGIMFRHIAANKHKQSKHPKVEHQDYLLTERQPYSDMFDSVSVSELDHRSSINDMRHAFKRTAKSIRAHYSAKGPATQLTTLRLAKN